MLREILKSLIDAKLVKRELLQLYAEDPTRSRIANAASHSLKTPQVQRAYKDFIDIWMREIKKDYYD